jgi:hypothetical protein
MENGSAFLRNENFEFLCSKDLFDVWQKLLETTLVTDNTREI